MKKDIFNSSTLIFFDGAMGTMIQSAGLKGADVPEIYNITHPDAIGSIHRAYIEAGSDVITANTFGANRIKLRTSGYSPDEVITRGIEIAKKAAGTDVHVALDIGPLGQLLSPMGTLTFNDAYDLFAEQMKAGQEAGADLVLIETMSDLYEAKAAVLAAKEHTKLPVICTHTFQKNGRTLMGNDPLAVIAVLEGLGVDALGANCSMGPDELLPVVEILAANSHVPILIQANAGLPEKAEAGAVYSITPEYFAESVGKMVSMGIRMAGGCCGTSPAYIRELRLRLDSCKPIKRIIPVKTIAASSRTAVEIGDGFKIIGQRINPTNRDDLTAALKQSDMYPLYEEAVSQKQEGADIIDINVGAKGINEADAMGRAVEFIQTMVPVPFMIDSSDYRVLEAGARVYNGKPIINSVNGTAMSLKHVLPLVKKYGACVVGMTFDEEGIPDTSEKRLEIAGKIVEAAASYGITKENIIIDCLALSAANNPDAAGITIKALSLVKKELGVKTILGISNISYGMKDRASLNADFLARAAAAGLDCAILDPSCDAVMAKIKG